MRKTIIDNENRENLSEGRSSGMGFAFLKKGLRGVYEAVQPTSPCKDYLAEVVFTERYNIPTKAHGLIYKEKLRLYPRGHAFMAIKILADRDGNYEMNDSIELDIEILDKNYKNIQKLINEIETKLELKFLTTIEKANDGFFLIDFSKEWTLSSISISLFSLLVRVAMHSDGTQDALTYLKSFNQMGGDTDLLRQAMPNLKIILKKKQLPPTVQVYSKDKLIKGFHKPHDDGVISWSGNYSEEAKMLP